MIPCTSSPSKSTTTTINNLPDMLLVEILSRLPHCKYIYPCKGVSKLWCALISDPYLIRRFLCRRRNPFPSSALALIPQAEEGKEHTTLLLLTKMLSKRRCVEWKETHYFSFLPGLQDYDHKAVVLGVCNDLALWSYRRDYYICNQYTKHWVRLPLAWIEGPVGFICDPYRWKVVRILPSTIVHGFRVEFFSETRQWREYKSGICIYRRSSRRSSRCYIT